jgi:choline dehydrogenase-like flavoprotein
MASLRRPASCIRCDAFDGFPCLLNGKADAQVMCVDPTLAAHTNVQLLIGAYVTRLETDAAGRTVTGVHLIRSGEQERHTADIVVVACGALSSALLLLRSANGTHPQGLANRSGQVGRNYMCHNQSVLMAALMREPNETVFQKTLALTDARACPVRQLPDHRHRRPADRGGGGGCLAGIADRPCMKTRIRTRPT